MRKSRGRRVDNGEWVYGWYVHAADGVFIMELEYYVLKFIQPEYHYQGMGCGLEDRNITDRYQAMEHGWEDAVDTCSQNHPEFIQVIPETVGQSTGLKDKDGKEIYEGDICIYSSTAFVGEVKYDIGCLQCAFRLWSTKLDGIADLHMTSDLEIIGNIHTELLEKE